MLDKFIMNNKQLWVLKSSSLQDAQLWLWLTTVMEAGLQVPLLKSGLSGMHTSTDAFSTRSCPEACAHCQNVEQQLHSLKVGVIIAAAVRDGWDLADVRDQLNDVGPIIYDVEVRQCPE
jgi:hypothetical protein